MEERGFLGELGDFFERTGITDVFRRIGSTVSPGSAQIPTSTTQTTAAPPPEKPAVFPWLVFIGGVLVAGTVAVLVFRK